MLTVPLEKPEDNQALIESVEGIRGEVAAGAPEELEVGVTGPAGAKVDQLGAIKGIDATLLLTTVAVVTLLLLLTYRSPLLWLLPLMGVGVASQATNALVYLLAKHAGLTMDAQSAGILTVLVFGAGTDYALLLISRYREELHRRTDRHEAMTLALRHAGPALLASAATVAIALLCLLAADLNLNRSLGLVGAIGIVCALVVMVTLLPALLVVFRRWLFWPPIPRLGTPAQRERTVWNRVGGLVGGRPRIVWSATAVALVALAFGVIGAKTGLTAEGMYHTTPESVTGQKMLAAHYPAGITDPAIIIANASSEQRVKDVARETPGVSKMLPSVRDGDLVQIPAVLSDPPDGAAAEKTVGSLRQEVRDVSGADAIVGGATATTLDTHEAWAHDRRVVIPLVLVVVFVVLALLLRSLVAPLVLVSTIVLSFFSALGVSSLVFQYVFGFEALDQSLVLLGFVFLVALGIDYNIFLMSRVREEVECIGHRRGVLLGLAVTGGVITSAGLVLAATFSVLGVMPLVLLAQIGFLVAFGVLLDTFVVRSVLVPALALDIGPAIWWPSKLARRASGEHRDEVLRAGNPG
jgi:RND superfamily putative drug exporter